MSGSESICLYCCLERGRAGGCETCGPGAPGKAPEPHPLCLPPGTLLNGQYRIGRVLGAGGFGITYLALDELLQHRVAVKEYMPRTEAVRVEDRCTVRPATEGDSETFRFGLGRFLDEARMLARISAQENPRIVTVLNFFEANGTAYLVMRYLEGQPLSRVLAARGGRLPEAEALYVATAILDGLREVHEHGLVHRDIKPQNVFVTNDGAVKILDFGAARYAVGNRSKSVTAVLTPPYAPHEQYYDSGQQGPWTDVYAVGATLLQMLTGSLPPEAPARMEHDPLVPPRDHPAAPVDPAVSDVLVKALAPRVADRFPGVREFQAALKAAAGGRIDGLDGVPPPRRAATLGAREAAGGTGEATPPRAAETVLAESPPTGTSRPLPEPVSGPVSEPATEFAPEPATGRAPARPSRRWTWAAVAAGAALAVAAAIYLVGRAPRAAAPEAAGPAGLAIGAGGDTVADRGNQLVWQRTVSAETYSRSEAAAYCRALSMRGGSWRLPTRSELESLVRRGTEPTIDTAAFPQPGIGEWFWTSTRSTESAGKTWCVSFKDGSVHEASDSNYSRVRCVRRAD